jgi:hypothetical protein
MRDTPGRAHRAAAPSGCAERAVRDESLPGDATRRAGLGIFLAAVSSRRAPGQEQFPARRE